MSDDTGKKQVREAAALKYNADTDDAPYVVALGRGVTAERMVEEAEEHDVQVVQDKKLAHVLNELSVGDEIPEDPYVVVSEILVFVSNMDNEKKAQFTQP